MFNYYPLDKKEHRRRKLIWDRFAARKPHGEAAIDFGWVPDAEECGKDVLPAEEIPLTGPKERNERLDAMIRRQVRRMHVDARSRYRSDAFPSLATPREDYGQSQALAEIFGSRLIERETQPGLYHPVPGVEAPGDVYKLKRRPVKDCMFYKSVEFAKYFYESTNGELAVRSPIYTGPIDTANYILGTTRLMEWVYDEPAALKVLLGMVTETLIEVISMYQKAVEGHTAPELVNCADVGYMVCSEVRHMISDETYREFEAPYLRLIGEACGLMIIHSCGCFERTIRATAEDPNIFGVDFQSRETDVSLALAESSNSLLFNIRRTERVAEFEWPDDESYYRYLMTVFTKPAPIIFHVYNIETYNKIRAELNGGPLGMFPVIP